VTAPVETLSLRELLDNAYVTWCISQGILL
jgi:hypothetical protein